MVSIEKTSDTNLEKLITFRLEANVNTYAAYMNEMESTRPDLHGYTYSNGAYTLSPLISHSHAILYHQRYFLFAKSFDLYVEDFMSRCFSLSIILSFLLSITHNKFFTYFL